MLTPFHLAFKVKDIKSTIEFYHRILGCRLGRQTEYWIDFDFFGHQLSAHVSDDIATPDYCGLVDDIRVPIPHFGCILSEERFATTKRNLENHRVNFLIKPQVRYQGKSGEQQTMFVLDFSNNPLEFKYFAHEEEIFKSN